MPHIEELAQQENVPANYLVQILNDLRGAGLIESRRGKQGGYILARPPSELSIADIIRAIDGELLECQKDVSGQSGKGVFLVLSALSAEFEQSAARKTVRDIIGADSGSMYFI
jgi:Rrf2 family protein